MAITGIVIVRADGDPPVLRRRPVGLSRLAGAADGGRAFVAVAEQKSGVVACPLAFDHQHRPVGVRPQTGELEQRPPAFRGFRALGVAPYPFAAARRVPAVDGEQRHAGRVPVDPRLRPMGRRAGLASGV